MEKTSFTRPKSILPHWLIKIDIIYNHVFFLCSWHANLASEVFVLEKGQLAVGHLTIGYTDNASLLMNWLSYSLLYINILDQFGMSSMKSSQKSFSSSSFSAITIDSTKLNAALSLR